jgi:hypothetical protein
VLNNYLEQMYAGIESDTVQINNSQDAYEAVEY